MLQGEHSAILFTFIKLSLIIKIFVLSIFEWLFYRGFTVLVCFDICVHRYTNTLTHGLYQYIDTDACLTADPGVTSLIPVRSHTLVEIDHEMISRVILLPSAVSFKKGCCQLQAKVCARSTG